MGKSILEQSQFVDMTFPRSGIDVSTGYAMQRTGTTPVGLNVRTFEPATNRARGGQRPGLSKYITTRPAGAALLQDLIAIVGVGYSPPGGSMQTSSSGRVVTLVATSGGNVYVASPGASAWVTPTNNTGFTPPMPTSGVVLSAVNNQKLYFAHGGPHQVFYNPTTNSVENWVTSDGTLPADKSGNTPRLICTWRGRTVVSGLVDDPQNWFMSRVSDPTDWNYAPFNTASDIAIAGNNSPLGLIGDVVTAMIPYTDDVLIMGGDHTIWQFQGDPMGGGSINLTSDAIGMAWGVPWCKGPDGTVYFVSNRTGIYSLVPGQAPQRISQQIENLLSLIDTGANTIRLIWDDRFQGLHVFITKTASATAAVHFFWEQRAGAWWTDVFENNNHNPLSCCVFDGNTPGDRVPLIGSWDGYVRSIDPTATTDDGTAINSAVVIGPLLTADLDQMLLKDLQCVLATASGSVTYSVYVGPTAEAALATTPVSTGTWAAGRNLSTQIRRAGHAVFVRITASNPWAMEQIRARIAGKGKVQRRGA